jgi:hypothetical protein
MKRFILMAGIAVLLFSCASLPEPESQGDSLVIGNLILDFPDGFFNQSRRTITSGVNIRLANLTKGTKFMLTTSPPGYFFFLTNGTDEFELESFEYRTEALGGRYNLGRTPMEIRIRNTPDKVIYLGHIKRSYTLPKLVKSNMEGSRTSWNFEVKWSGTWDQEALRLYIAEISPDSPWLTHEVMRCNNNLD